MGKACSTHRSNKKCIKILVGKPEGQRPLRRTRCRLEYNMRMDLREIGWRSVDWKCLIRGVSGRLLKT